MIVNCCVHGVVVTDRCDKCEREERYRQRVEAESATGGGPVWTGGRPPPDPFCGGCGAPTGTPHDEECGSPRWSLVALNLLPYVPTTNERPITATYALNVIEALKMRSDVDADVMRRLLRHVAEMELLLESVTRSYVRTYAYLEDSDDGDYRRWRCCLPTAADGSTACVAAGRWIYGGRSDADQIVGRALASHLLSHRRRMPTTDVIRSHPMVGEYVSWDEMTDDECDQALLDEDGGGSLTLLPPDRDGP